MGKATGFLEYSRVEEPFRPEAERLKDFAYLHAALPAQARREQAARCMNCGVPFCQSNYGCPLHNRVPEWNDLLYQGRTREALQRLLVTAPFPEFTGRVCPQLCEKACMLGDDATTNRDNELYLVEEGFRNGWIAPRVPARRTDRRVAVVGSGPAGLAAADLLNRLGHRVTVVERADRPGGLLMYGIPNMKLPKEVVARRVGLMKAEGVEFRLNTEADASLRADFDSVELCRERTMLALPKSHPLARAYAEDDVQGFPRISFAAMDGEPFIRLQPRRQMAEVYDKLCKVSGAEPHVIFEANSIIEASELCAAGLGATLVTDMLVQSWRWKEQAFFFELEEEVEERHLMAVYSRQRQLSLAAQRFIDFLLHD